MKPKRRAWSGFIAGSVGKQTGPEAPNNIMATASESRSLGPDIETFIPPSEETVLFELSDRLLKFIVLDNLGVGDERVSLDPVRREILGELVEPPTIGD